MEHIGQVILYLNDDVVFSVLLELSLHVLDHDPDHPDHGDYE